MGSVCREKKNAETGKAVRIRQVLVGQAASSGWTAAMMAEALGISEAALHRWLGRRKMTSAGCRRGRPPVVDAEVRRRVRACYLAHCRQWGPRVLAAWCLREGLGRYSAGTIATLIEDLRPERKPATSGSGYEVRHSNVMWSEDGTGFRRGGRKRELLVVQDEHSRLKLNWELASGPACSGDVCRYLEEAFRRHGAPLVLKHDGDSVFHTAQVSALLVSYGVLDLTAPPGYPKYNGRQERSMRDIKSYERALRKKGHRGGLEARIRATMQDLNEDRPRPVLGGRTAREAYMAGLAPLPDREAFRHSVDAIERKLVESARTRLEVRNARRRAIEQALESYGLIETRGDMSHTFLAGVGTE